jgi:hypothetical protein
MAFGATIQDALDMLEKNGFRGSFRVAGPRALECLQCHKTSDPIDVPLMELVRVEGVSDPADEQLIAGLVCPACSTQGALLLAFGSIASAAEGEVLNRLEDRREEQE